MVNRVYIQYFLGNHCVIPVVWDGKRDVAWGPVDSAEVANQATLVVEM